jgi:hypothetical protein
MVGKKNEPEAWSQFQLKRKNWRFLAATVTPPVDLPQAGRILTFFKGFGRGGW